MAAVGSSPVSRRLFIALLIFGLFVLFDIALFGWLIFRSLSEREVNEILLQTQDDAETVARRIAERARQEGGDLYTAIALEHETRTFIDSVLHEREIVLTVEIRDAHGRLVFRSQKETTIPVAPNDGVVADPERLPPLQVPGVTTEERTRTFGDRVEDIEVPIGDLGSVQIGISTVELEERVAMLRRDLVARASVVGAVTLLLLTSALVALWMLFQRAMRLEEQAAESERMAYIGTLASGLAHEIRNPLNSLHLNMQMLEEETEAKSDTGTRLLAITRSEIRRLERLVTDFLAYAKPRPLDVEEIAPGDLLERVAVLLGPEARRRGATITVEDDSGGASLLADAAQMKQLLLNLAQNSLNAVEEAGRRGHVLLAARRRGPHLVLEVTDDGVGVPPEVREKMFDLFYSTRKGGTGLGLAIVARIVKDHGGRMDVASTPGKGTTVSIHLAAGPAHNLPAHEPAPAERPRADGGGRLRETS